MNSTTQTVLQQFQQAGSWEQRARLLLHWGDQLEPLRAEERCPANQVHGCESLVWVVAEQQGQHWHFRASSEARLLRGLLALLLIRLNVPDSTTLDITDWFNQLGLARQLSPSRTNGLNAVMQRLCELTQAAY